jgi:hypothetical protein
VLGGLATSPALRAHSRRRWPHSAGPYDVMHITFSCHRGRWRSVADACGLWRTSATDRREVPAFALRRQWSHSRYRSRGGAAEGAGQIGPGHRRSGARDGCVRVGNGPRATRFTASRSPICRDQHLIPGSACPHVNSAWLPGSKCRDGSGTPSKTRRREESGVAAQSAARKEHRHGTAAAPDHFAR